MTFKSWRKESKRDYGIDSDHDTVDIEQVNTGCLLRIADATELMARRYNELIDDRNKFERWFDAEVKITQRLARSNAALRGCLKRLKATGKR